MFFFVIAVNANILYAIILSNDIKPGISPLPACINKKRQKLDLVWFDSLSPSQQLWSCWDGQVT